MSLIKRCPGLDKKNWTSKDIYELPCPFCGNMIEFWKDDIKRTCKNCGKIIKNTKINLGCAKWCKFSDNCTGE